MYKIYYIFSWNEKFLNAFCGQKRINLDWMVVAMYEKIGELDTIPITVM